MLFLISLEINAVATVDVDGDGNTEVFVGTDEGLLIYPDITSSEYKKSDITSPVKHISYDPENLRLILTLDDPSAPIVFLRVSTLKDSVLPLTGEYKKAYMLRGKLYLLSNIGLFEYHNDSLRLILEGIKDITVCGIGGSKSLFALGEDRIYIFGERNLWIKGEGEYLICGDTLVYTLSGYIKPNNNGFRFIEDNNNSLSLFNTQMKNNNFISLATYMNRLYVIYGKNGINRTPLSTPYITYSHPFLIRMGDIETFVSDMNLYHGVSYGMFPIDIGTYEVSNGLKSVEININEYGSYDISQAFLGDEILNIDYGRGVAEIYVNINKPSKVELYIINITGNRVKTLYKGFKNSSFKISWSGYDDNGFEVKNGVYFVKCIINGRTYVKRMVWLK